MAKWCLPFKTNKQFFSIFLQKKKKLLLTQKQHVERVCVLKQFSRDAKLKSETGRKTVSEEGSDGAAARFRGHSDPTN